MKHFVLLAAMAAATLSAQAQNYITEAPAGGFDFNQGKDYVVLYAPDVAIEKMGSKIVSNQNLDPNAEKNTFQYWVTDWDKTLLTLYNVPEEGGKNSYGTDDYLNMTPLYDWGSGQFHALTQKYDLSMLNDDYIMHIGLRDFGGATSQLRIQILPDQKLSYKLEVNAEVGAADGDYVGVGSIGHDSKWYSVDIPLKDLNDPEGDFGFEPDFTKVGENVFVIGFNKPTCSTYTTGAVDPISGLKTITVTKVNSAASLDGVFFYKKAGDTGVNNLRYQPAANNDQLYNLAGQRVGKDYKGLVIKNGKKMIRK